MPIVTRHAPAKLNLTLEIVGKRDDGYHLLDSLVAFTEYGDTITVEPADRLSLRIDGPHAAALGLPEDDNLVTRAARLLADATGRSFAARISLTKRLPIASGIGGGSSDAAATLLALAELWRLELDAKLLERIGLRIGADVPVCLGGHSARLQGIGEIITASPPLPAAPIVLVNPGIGLSTPSVFRARRLPFSPSHEQGILHAPPSDAAALAAAIAPYGNDLAEPAMRLLPVIGDVLAALRASDSCLTARMSGSGATCFALYPDDFAAENTAAALRQRHPDWWIVATRLQRG